MRAYKTTKPKSGLRIAKANAVPAHTQRTNRNRSEIQQETERFTDKIREKQWENVKITADVLKKRVVIQRQR